MKKLFFILSIGFLLTSCSEDAPEVKKENLEEEVLTETVGGVFYEYYPGKKQVKITGPIDKKNERNGRWEYYSPNGRELGFTMWVHGVRHGHSYTSYPDASPRYLGEYSDDKKIGVWKFYERDGTVQERDFGLPKDE